MESFNKQVLKTEGFVSAITGSPFEPVPIYLKTPNEAAEDLINITNSLETRLEISQSFSVIRKRGFNVLAGVFSKKILGLYCPDYEDNQEERLILIPDNIKKVARALEIDNQTFSNWVLSHEMTHVAQFHSGNRELSRVMLEEISNVFKKESSAENLKAIMTWTEGSADFAMDQPGLIEEKEIKSMREKINQRREKFNLFNFIIKIMGNKTGQYINGYKFAEQVSKKAGVSEVFRPILEPGILPTPEEIKNPDIWLSRAGH